MSKKNKMIDKIAGKAIVAGVGFVTAMLGEAMGETVGYGLKMKLFPEFRDAEIAAAQRAIEEADYIREERERRKKTKKKGGEKK